MNKRIRVGERVKHLSEEQEVADQLQVRRAITLLQNASIAEMQQNGNLTDAQKTQLKNDMAHIRAGMHSPAMLDMISVEPLAMLLGEM